MQDRRSHDDEESKRSDGKKHFPAEVFTGKRKKERREKEEKKERRREGKRRIFQLFWLKSIVKSSQREEGEDIS